MIGDVRDYDRGNTSEDAMAAGIHEHDCLTARDGQVGKPPGAATPSGCKTTVAPVPCLKASDPPFPR
jgi:hypothetical protein